ncbi:MAG: energy transducer TonB [Phycisphaerales bacterium]|nr:energy transducer TonB [Hyphomonadaceae bacterium]
MILRAFAAVLLVLAAPPAAAQYVQSVPWAEQQPSAADFRETYPVSALANGLEGYVTLLCTITDERKLDCALETETPQDQGFGEAALRLSRLYVVRRVEEEPRAVIGSRVRVPIRYVLMD